MTAVDKLVSVLLFAVAFAYLAVLPRNLGATDEGLFLYEAKRLLDGDVFFRDVYEIIPPGSHYAMALLFRLFGTNIATAKLGMAAFHATTVAASYAAACRLGARAGFAAAAGLLYLALCPLAWPYASPHWVGACFSAILLLVALSPRLASSPGRAALAGALSGILVMVQHQRGVFFAAALGAAIVAERWVERRIRGAAAAGSTARQLAAAAAGNLLVVAPAFALLVALAGVRPVVQALVVNPILHYHKVNAAVWGGGSWLTRFLADFTSPRVLRYAPAVLAVALARVLVGLGRRGDLARVRGLTTLIVFGAAAAASIAYLPDFIHLSFIAPLFFVAAAELLEWALGALRRPAWLAPLAGWVLTACLLGAIAFQLRGNATRMEHLYPVPADTAFGRIDYTDGKEPGFAAKVAELLGNGGEREIFSYPAYPSLYLITGTRNPTPYQLLMPPYSQPDQVHEVMRILEERRVPVVFVFAPFLAKNDELLGYVRAHYDSADAQGLFWKRRPPADTEGSGR